MKYIPILFSTPMVQAERAGRKTMTRRKIKNHPANEYPDDECWDDCTHDFSTYRNEGHEEKVFGPEWIIRNSDGDIDGIIGKCPYGQPGDVLWVRETFKPKYVKGGYVGFKSQYPGVCPYFYAADGESEKGYGQWKPAIHMPKTACRTFLQVLSVRVERLQDISGDDVLAEGVDNGKSNKAMGERWENMQRMAFETLWQSINGPDSWAANPWVWVIEFKRIEKPTDFIK